MSAISYEILREAPVDSIVELYKAGGWWQESEAWRQVIPRMIAGSFCFMVARAADGTLVGMGRAISDGCSDAYIQDVVVLSAYRKQGIGAEIIRRLVAFCQQRQITWVGLIAEPGTQPFYQSLGFGELVGYRPMLFGKRG